MSGKKKRQKINRSPGEMLFTLQSELRLLAEHEAQARGGRAEYAGEVAGKLRLLVHRQEGSALLLRLMERYNINPRVEMNGPSVSHMTLQQYLDTGFCMIRVDGEPVEISNAQLIAKWSQQQGGSHQADAIDDDLHAAANSSVFVFGQPIHVHALLGIARTVGAFGVAFLNAVARAQQDRRDGKAPRSEPG